MEPIDSWEIDGPIEGLKFKVVIVRDDDKKPYELVARPKTHPNEPPRYRKVREECYSRKDVTAWKKDEWQYVGTIVTPVYQGIEISEAEASLWGIEWGDHWNIDNRRCVDHVVSSEEGCYDLPGECMDNLKSGALDDAIVERNLAMLNEQERAEKLAALNDLLKAAK